MASSTSYTLSKNVEKLLTLAETMDKDDVKEIKGTTQDPTLPFYTEDGFTDVILEVDGEMLYTNRSLLAYASPVFACMFTAEFKEKHEKVGVNINVPAPRKMFFLRYITFNDR